MDKLPKDMIGKLVDELSPQDFINFCAANTSENVTRICNMNELWDRRLRKDFPYIVEKFEGVGEQEPKADYLEIFKRFSKMAETFTDTVLEKYGELRKFLSPDFKRFLYGSFYDLCTTSVRNVLRKDYNDDDWIVDSVLDTYYNGKFSTIKFQYFPGMKHDEERFGEYWQDTIESPLEQFVRETINFLKLFD